MKRKVMGTTSAGWSWGGLREIMWSEEASLWRERVSKT